MLTPPDSVIAVPWLCATVLLGSVAWVLASRLSPADTRPGRIAQTIVIAWAHLVVVSIALGAVGFLHPIALIIGVSAAAMITLTITQWRMKHIPTNVGHRSGWRLWTCIWAVMLAFWVGHMVNGGLLRFPDDWDTLMYHLPTVDHWLQARSLYSTDGLRWSDPGNNELITLWIVAPFSGDYLHVLTNLPAVVLLACAAVELGRRVGLAEEWRNLAALVVVTNFVVSKQLTDTENDVAVAAIFLTALAFALRYAEQNRNADLVLAAVALGLLSGVKYYALGYVSVAASTAAFLIGWRRGGRTVVRAAVVGALGISALGGYWYARNWAFGGSPLYPLGFSDETNELGAMYPGSVWATTFLGNGRPELLKLAINAVWGMTGPCQVAALVTLPLAILWLVLGGRTRSHLPPRRNRDVRFALSYATLAAGGVLLITPFAVEDAPGTLNQMHWKYCPVRYGLCFLSLVVLTFAVVLQDISQRLRAWTIRRRGRRWSAGRALVHSPLLLLAAGLVVQLTTLVKAGPDAAFLESLLVAADLLLTGAIVRLVWGSWPRLRRPFVLLLTLAVTASVAWGCDQLSQRWHAGFESHYDRMLGRGLFRYLKDTQPPGTRVCVLDLRPYPFFGSARQFRVCQPASIRSQQWLVEYVRTQEITIVAARFDLQLTSRGWPNCWLWLNESKGQFVPVRNGPWPYTVFGVTTER